MSETETDVCERIYFDQATIAQQLLGDRAAPLPGLKD
jgi:hypothetical protein